jgi:hypothetical protein
MELQDVLYCAHEFHIEILFSKSAMGAESLS